MMGERRTPIGLDVGSKSVSAVQLAPRPGGGFEVAAAVRLPRGTDSGGGALTVEESARVWEVLCRQGFTGRRVVMAAPETMVFSAALELPPRSSGAPVEELAKQELARSVKREVGEVEVAVWDVPRPTRGGGSEATHVMAMGLGHAEAEALVEAVETGAGVVVEALECRCCAMARAGLAATGSEGGAGVLRAIVDAGDAALSVSVLHGGCVVYDRVVKDCGLDSVRRVFQDQLRGAEGVDLLMEAVCGGQGVASVELGGMAAGTVKGVVEDHVSQVVQELRTVLAYALHKYACGIGPVLLTGPGAGVEELGAKITSELDLVAKVVRLESVAGVGDANAGERGRDPALAVAAGLAMRPRAGIDMSSWRGVLSGLRRKAA